MVFTFFTISFLVIIALIYWKIAEEKSDKNLWLSRFVVKADGYTMHGFEMFKKALKHFEHMVKFFFLYTIPLILWKIFVFMKKKIDKHYYEMINFTRGRHDFKKKGPVSFFLKNVSEYRNNLVKREEDKDL